VLCARDNESLDASQGTTELRVPVPFRWYARLRVDVREVRIGSSVAVNYFAMAIFRLASVALLSRWPGGESVLT
ncbi:hypothetical protein LCGC14_1357760, partial [marine sediment metagenome]